MPVDIGSLVANGTKAAPTSVGGWGDILPLIVDAGSSILGGWLSGEGERQAADAQGDAANRQLELYRQIYGDQRALAAPGYLTGGAATNALAQIYGLPTQDYTAALNNGGMGGGPANGLSTNWGAGQPVVGHSGGGGANALASLAGTAAGSVFGGPIGGAVGGAIGGLFRKGGDNWTTLATSAPEGFDYNAYFAGDPGLAREWSKADVRSLFNNNRDAYLYWHARGGDGKWNPNTLATLDGYEVGANGLPVQKSAAAASTTNSGTATGSNALADPMKAFEATPYYDIAVKGFRGVDTPEVNSAYARGGKVLSGAQSIALDERGKNRLGGAFNDYTNGLRSLAEMNQTPSSQIGSAATNYGNAAGGAITNAGQAKGNALASGYAGMNQGISGALNALTKYGQSQWGWA